MNVLSRLALSQIRRKRTRTVITAIAIVLSSSLLTAVINFVISGNTMLVGFLGEDYGLYKGAYQSILLIPAAVLGMLVIAMSVIVISNVFRMSAHERISEFGVLKCVGATKEQIFKTILYESFFLIVGAVPVGVVVGYLLSFLGIRAANGYMDELNVLVRAMMRSVTFELSFVFSPMALILSVLISAGTVVFSAVFPAKRAMRISALDCIRGGRENRKKCGRSKRNVDGTRAVEYQLAHRNTVSDRKRMKSAVTAFSFSIVLLITMSGLKEVADGILNYISMDTGYTMIADYTSNYDTRINPETGRREYYYVRTIDNKRAEEITNELAAYEDGEIFGCGQDYFTYVTNLEESRITKQMREVLDNRSEADQHGFDRSEYELEVEIIIVDEKHYGEICDRADAGYGDAILINDYKYNDNGKERHIVPLSESVRFLRLEKADGSAETVRIGGVLTGENIPKELIYPNIRPVRLIVPYAEVRGYNWMTSPDDEEGYITYARAVLEKYFPQGNQDYGEAGFVCRVFGAQDFSKIMNIAVVIASVFLYGFVILLGLIGVLNVTSMVIFGVKMRAREFAVLQSIGMTSESLQKMLYLESILCAGRALVMGVPAGVGLVLLLKYCVQKLFPIPFQMPWAAIMGSVAMSFILMWGAVRVSIKALKDQNLIETIKM